MGEIDCGIAGQGVQMARPARPILILSFAFISGVLSQFVEWRPLNAVWAGEAHSQTRLVSDDPAGNIELPSFLEFRDQLKASTPNQIVGVYAPGVMALQVEYQPASQPNYVSSAMGTATLFASAQRRGTIGLLAHNYASGEAFFELEPGQIVLLLYGDGHYERYRILHAVQYRALSPHSPFSTFTQLGSPEEILSAHDLFYDMYGGGQPLVFQTCIERDSELSWGRHFALAVHYEEHPATICALKKLTGTGCGVFSGSRDLTSDIRFAGVHAR